MASARQTAAGLGAGGGGASSSSRPAPKAVGRSYADVATSDGEAEAESSPARAAEVAEAGEEAGDDPEEKAGRARRLRRPPGEDRHVCGLTTQQVVLTAGVVLMLLTMFIAWLGSPTPKFRYDLQYMRMHGGSGGGGGLFASSPEEAACKAPAPGPDFGRSSTEEAEPRVQASAEPGQRVRMQRAHGLEYQLFLPASWTPGGVERFPVVVFLHGAGDGRFSVMNSQSLPRLLARDQSTSFDPRPCWCLESEYEGAEAKREPPEGSREPFLEEEEEIESPMANCRFAATFPAIAVMPQGFLPADASAGWQRDALEKVEALTRDVIKRYRGDPSRVSLTGQSAGGAGAWAFAAWHPQLWSAVSVICAPTSIEVVRRVEGLPLWIVGWTGDGEDGNDDLVAALRGRASGAVRYTRYTKAPAPPDPLYRHMLNHASYDLIYRDPRFWEWTFAQRRPDAASAWASP